MDWTFSGSVPEAASTISWLAWSRDSAMGMLLTGTIDTVDVNLRLFLASNHNCTALCTTAWDFDVSGPLARTCSRALSMFFFKELLGRVLRSFSALPPRWGHALLQGMTRALAVSRRIVEKTYHTAESGTVTCSKMWNFSIWYSAFSLAALFSSFWK